MTATEAYLAYQRTQGLGRFEDAPETIPFLVTQLDEELPSLKEPTFIHVGGRSDTLYCCFNLGDSADPYYYTVLVDYDWGTPAHQRFVRVTLSRPYAKDWIVGASLKTGRVFKQAEVKHFKELLTWTIDESVSVGGDEASWCSLV